VEESGHLSLANSVIRPYCVFSQFLAAFGVGGAGAFRGGFFVRVRPRAVARFRLSIKDNTSRWGLKGERVDVPGRWGERRYQIRVNGKEAEEIREATLTEVFDRLRRWLVARAE